MSQSEYFNKGAEKLRQMQIAVDPRGNSFIDGYALIIVDHKGEVHYTERAPNQKSVDGDYVKGLEYLKGLRWNKQVKPNTPSVEMVLQHFFPELDVKAYAMWACSDRGVTAQTHAVYKELNAEEETKICDTIDTSIELRNNNATFTMR